MANLDSIFKKKSGKGKKPATLNVQSVAAALEPRQQNGNSGSNKNSNKDIDDDDEWIAVKDKKKVIANTTGKSMEAFVQEMVEEEIDLVSKIQIEETRNLLQSVRERNIQNLKEISTSSVPDPSPPVPPSQSTIWKSSRIATKKLPEKEDFPTLGSVIKSDMTSKAKGGGEKPKENPPSIWEIPSLDLTRKNDSSSSNDEQSPLAAGSDITNANNNLSELNASTAAVPTNDNHLEVVVSVEVNQDDEGNGKLNSNSHSAGTSDSTSATVSEQPPPAEVEMLNTAEANTTSLVDGVSIASCETTTTVSPTTTSTEKSEDNVGSEAKTEDSSSEMPTAIRKPKKKKGVFMEI